MVMVAMVMVDMSTWFMVMVAMVYGCYGYLTELLCYGYGCYGYLTEYMLWLWLPWLPNRVHVIWFMVAMVT